MKRTLIALAFTVTAIGTPFALTNAVSAANPSMSATHHENFYAMRMDSCPYYPSPVVCRNLQPQAGTNEATSQ